MQKHKRIPRSFERLIRAVTDDMDWPHLQGDYHEIYRDIYSNQGRMAALRWVLRQIINASLVDLERTVFWRFTMLKNMLKLAVRHIKRQKLYSLINILGLAVGLTSSILLFLWVQDEKSWDAFHQNAASIYRVIIVDEESGGDQGFAVTPLGMAPVIKSEIPEIELAARTSVINVRFSNQETESVEKGLYVSPDFLRIFSFRFLEGDPGQSLSTLEKIVISERTAQKFFGSEDPLGRTIKTKAGTEFLVSGVFQDIPRQSHLTFDFLLNFQRIENRGTDLTTWGNISFYSYCTLKEGSDPEVVAQKIKAISDTHRPELKLVYRLQPLRRLYLDPPLKFDNVDHGSRQSVTAFTFIAIAILLIACFNFINLATARSSRRALEVGLRKVVGARRPILVRQFLGETFFVTLIASILAFVGVVVLLQTFNSVSGKDFSLAILTQPHFLLSILGVLIFTSLISGFYPALLLSSFQPAKILKGKSRMSSKGSGLRKILIVFQFALTTAVLIGVFVSNNQLHFLRNKELGYDKSDIVATGMNRDLVQQSETLKQKLLAIPYVRHVSATANLPIHLQSGSSVDDWEGKSMEGNVHFKLLWVDGDYLETFDLKMAEGRFYAKERFTEPYEFVLNQAAVKRMGLESPIGKRAVINKTEGIIIGVVEDFHFRSLHHEVEPAALLYEPARFYTLVIKLDPGAAPMQDIIRDIEAVWKELAPGEVFTYTFLEDLLDGLYEKEEVQGRLFIYFSGLALFIACLGLMGVVSFTTTQRTKEIGIRKVLGASTQSLVGLLLQDFLRWVVLANLMAWPAAFWIMSQWLGKYAYHVSLSADVFVAASGVALFMALLTVAYQLFRACRTNPVDSLRYE
jgi:putative ABC transport system permease protein